MAFFCSVDFAQMHQERLRKGMPLMLLWQERSRNLQISAYT